MKAEIYPGSRLDAFRSLHTARLKQLYPCERVSFAEWRRLRCRERAQLPGGLRAAPEARSPQGAGGRRVSSSYSARISRWWPHLSACAARDIHHFHRQC